MRSPPPFLRDIDYNGDLPLSSSFVHSRADSDGRAHVLCWPSESDTTSMILFLPGNPGILQFYVPFLSSLHQNVDRGTSILAHSHLGHTPTLPAVPPQSRCLIAQVDGVLELLDSATLHYGRHVKITLIGHSVGSWLAVQVLKHRSTSVDRVVLLFPTISNLSSTPNGKRFSWLFRPPIPTLVSTAFALLRHIPLVPILSRIYPKWPKSQILVAGSFIRSPATIEAVMTLAHDEMLTIRALDAALLRAHAPRISAYVSEQDAWFGAQLQPLVAALGTAHGVVRAPHDMPHAFCIDQDHAERVAVQCALWVKQGYVPREQEAPGNG